MFGHAKKILSVIGIGLLAGCAASKPIPIRQGPPIAAPAYTSGEQWAYHVVSPQGGPANVRISYNGGKFDHDNREIWDGTVWATVYRADSKLKPLSFPLAPGKTWTYDYEAEGRRGTFVRHAEVKVIGPTAQPVKTRAGQFKATEIRRVETWGSAQRETTYFYSPDTNSVVKLRSTIYTNAGNRDYEMELVKYNGGR